MDGLRTIPYVHQVWQKMTSVSVDNEMTLTAQCDAKRLLLRDCDMAALLGCSVRHVWALDSRGLIPESVTLGKLRRWSRFVVLRWIRDGCPPRSNPGRDL